MKRTIFYTVLVMLLFSTSMLAQESPCMLCDFETGENTSGPVGGGTGYVMYYFGSETITSPVVSPGAAGTNYCVVLRSAADNDQPMAFYIDTPGSKTMIEEAYGANRFTAWIKIHPDYELKADRNLHFGTYTRDPVTGSPYQDGEHYYHYYNIPGGYWTKIIANEHPTHKTSYQGNYIENNPTAPEWNYYDGFTRFYISLPHDPDNPPEGEWEWYIDELEFYHEDEPEDIEITSISCTYFGAGHFQLNWRGGLKVASPSNHYELRYSTSPITNANYNSATMAPGCSDITKVDGSYNWMTADFSIPVTSGTAYFAIRDITSGSPYVARIDYPISEKAEQRFVLVYPNPCRFYMGETDVTFDSLYAGDVINVFDISGKLVYNSGSITDSPHTWDINGISDGTYFYIIKGGREADGKIVIIR